MWAGGGCGRGVWEGDEGDAEVGEGGEEGWSLVEAEGEDVGEGGAGVGEVVWERVGGDVGEWGGCVGEGGEGAEEGVGREEGREGEVGEGGERGGGGVDGRGEGEGGEGGRGRERGEDGVGGEGVGGRGGMGAAAEVEGGELAERCGGGPERVTEVCVVQGEGAERGDAEEGGEGEGGAEAGMVGNMVVASDDDGDGVRVGEVGCVDVGARDAVEVEGLEGGDGGGDGDHEAFTDGCSGLVCDVGDGEVLESVETGENRYDGVGEGEGEVEVESLETGSGGEEGEERLGCGGVDVENTDVVQIGGGYGLEEVTESVEGEKTDSLRGNEKKKEEEKKGRNVP